MRYLITQCCFDKTIIYTDQQPIGFKDWSKLITYKKCNAYLPSGDILSIKAYVTNQGDFDAGSYTKALLHRYYDSFL